MKGHAQGYLLTKYYQNHRKRFPATGLERRNSNNFPYFAPFRLQMGTLQVPFTRSLRPQAIYHMKGHAQGYPLTKYYQNHRKRFPATGLERRNSNNFPCFAPFRLQIGTLPLPFQGTLLPSPLSRLL